MYIEITFEIQGETFDIYIDDRQKIGSVSNVLRESGKISKMQNIKFYKTKLNEDTISGNYTFREANILTGEHIIAID